VVYTPNSSQQNEVFWKTLNETYTSELQKPKPYFLLGDFNLIENPIDRLLTRPDHDGQVLALQELKRILNVVDG
jgi:exonuclease III